MDFLQIIFIYSFFGAVWCFYMEWYTTNNLEGRYGQPWNNRERWFHVWLWPYSLGTWLLAIIEHWFGPWDN